MEQGLRMGWSPRRRRQRSAAGLALAIAIALVPVFTPILAGQAAAIDIEKMVMPGPLAKAHAKLEKDCGSCHQAFDIAAQRGLCLACHEDVGRDLEAKQGFHGRSPLASGGQCRSCHPDHLGRDADIRGAGESTFDHAQTDFPLRGRHAAVACAGCHPAGQERREAKSDCYACHRKDDKHQGALSTDCQKCHGESGWATTRFDHAKTKYPLTGAHAKAACDGCHGGGRYAETPTDCVACHAIDDKHAGRFGPRCADCHDTARWRKQGFDHAKESGFALTGAHASAACATCHREPPGQRELPRSCTGCHAADDAHAGRFGKECGTCHATAKWTDARFDHATKAKFPLQGAHARLACNGCHTKDVAREELPTRCEGCHARDDVHRGALGRECAECHGPESFSADVRFDHDQTRFPLLGLHASVACESCHADHRFQRTDFACRACHAADDVHRRSLGTTCEGCHNPNGWGHWRFDHDRQTKFALHGAHADLACSGCHKTPLVAGVRTASRCVDCHARSDAHRGEFGRQCETCHAEKAWKPASFRQRTGGKR